MAVRQHLLEQFSPVQLRDSAVAHEWLTVVGHLDAAYMKKDLLRNRIDSNLTVDRFDTVLAIVSRFESDVDEQDVYISLMNLPQMQMREPAYAVPWLAAVGRLDPSYMKKDLLLRFIGKDPGAVLAPALFDTVLGITRRFGSGEDEQEVYKRMVDLRSNTAEEWVRLIQASAGLDADYMKGDLLRTIAPRMPWTDSLRAAYRTAAKSIRGDDEYGRTMRAVN